LTLEPITEDLEDEPGPRAAAPGRAAGTRSRLSDSLPPIDEVEPEPGPRSSGAGRPAPARGASSSLGRFLGPLGPRSDSADPGSSIRVEPRSDPAADAAVKRRLENQIEQTLGDRVRTFEVLVVGRSVVLRARASRFWQRRSVRRSLETLPLPAGYRARVEMLD
jgi:hypothetical protein